LFFGRLCKRRANPERVERHVRATSQSGTLVNAKQALHGYFSDPAMMLLERILPWTPITTRGKPSLTGGAELLPSS